MAVIETDISDVPARREDERVLLRRVERLRHAGSSLVIACDLAASCEVDLHEAVELVSAGCAPDTAARILLR